MGGAFSHLVIRSARVQVTNQPTDRVTKPARYQVMAKSLVEHFLFWRHQLRVQRVKTVLVVLLALFWVAASNHCKLEKIPGLAFLDCCADSDTAPRADDGCETDGCAFETALYKTENAQHLVPAPVLLLAAFLVPGWADLSVPQSVNHILPDAAPMELPRIWQFSYRTALPPRAPSLPS